MQEIKKPIVPPGVRIWPHELRVAKILSLAGFSVEFIPEARIPMPDIYLDHTMYEIKSPVSDKINAVQRNLTKALAKCPNIIFDSSRMKVNDEAILRELIKRRKIGKGLKKLLFIDKRQEIIDVEGLI